MINFGGGNLVAEVVDEVRGEEGKGRARKLEALRNRADYFSRLFRLPVVIMETVRG